jgi:hypothetical protein
VKFGYRITYFDAGDERGEFEGLPDHLICDETLDENLDRIKEYLRAWMEKEGSNESMTHLNISVLGPFPEDRCVVDHRTPEQRLSDSDSPEERFGWLGDAAMSRVGAGDVEAARTHIYELQEMLPRFKDHLYLNDAIEKVHIVLGRLAIQDGKVDEAKRHLIEAASTKGSPTMCSFGPNMSLARDLLLAGEKQAVLDYFQACRKFWESGSDDLDEWEMYVSAGRVPDFRGNLSY